MTKPNSLPRNTNICTTRWPNQWSKDKIEMCVNGQSTQSTTETKSERERLMSFKKEKRNTSINLYVVHKLDCTQSRCKSAWYDHPSVCCTLNNKLSDVVCILTGCVCCVSRLSFLRLFRQKYLIYRKIVILINSLNKQASRPQRWRWRQRRLRW